MITERQQKEAIRRMKFLQMDKKYIEAFEKSGTIMLFENFIGDPITKSNDTYLMDLINNYENTFDNLVYAVTHELSPVGECYNLMIVSKYENDWSMEMYPVDPFTAVTYAYVDNYDAPECSELGSVSLKINKGGIKRVY